MGWTSDNRPQADKRVLSFGRIRKSYPQFVMGQRRSFPFGKDWEVKQLRCTNRALVGARDESGNSIFSGKNFAGFTNEEEELAGWTQVNHICADTSCID
jgi:hypothetical protein